MAASRTIRVEIIGDASSLNRALGQAQTRTSKFGAIAKTALVGGAAAGLYALGKAAKIGFDEFQRGQEEAAQTAAVIKSTGGAPGITAKHVQDLAQAQLRLTGIDDELIVSAENLLLTFTNIRNEAGKGNDIFDRATKITEDLSVALGQDMKTSAIQVGKALQNPTVGLTALRRVGVSFTEQQKDQIIALDESGKHLKAQKLILHELAKEFGGSAAAAGKTFSGQIAIAQERLRNFAGVVVGKAIPYLQRFIIWVGPYAHDALELLKSGIATVQSGLHRFGEVLKRHQDTVNKVITVLGFLWKAYMFLWKVEIKVLGVTLRVWAAILDKVLGAVEGIVGAVGRMWNWIRDKFNLIKGKLGFLGDAFNVAKSVAKTAFGAIVGFIHSLIAPIQAVIGWVERLIGWLERARESHAAATGLAAGPGPSRFGDHRAMGGPVSAGRTYLVGERGPELFTPRNSGRIIANGAGGVPVAVYLDSDVLWRGLARAESRRARR